MEQTPQPQPTPKVNVSLRKEFQICALCRHLTVVDSGREFEKIADTEYLTFRCQKLGWKSTDHYLMDSDPVARFQQQQPFDCPHWEQGS